MSLMNNDSAVKLISGQLGAFGKEYDQAAALSAEASPTQNPSLLFDAVEISSDKNIIGIGENHQVTYTFKITNKTSEDATNVSVKVTIPKGINIISTSVPETIVNRQIDSEGNTILTVGTGSVLKNSSVSGTLTVEATGFSQPLENLQDFLWNIKVTSSASGTFPNFSNEEYTSNTAVISTQVDSSKGLAEEIANDFLLGSSTSKGIISSIQELDSKQDALFTDLKSLTRGNTFDSFSQQLTDISNLRSDVEMSNSPIISGNAEKFNKFSQSIFFGDDGQKNVDSQLLTIFNEASTKPSFQDAKNLAIKESSPIIVKYAKIVAENNIFFGAGESIIKQGEALRDDLANGVNGAKTILEAISPNNLKISTGTPDSSKVTNLEVNFGSNINPAILEAANKRDFEHLKQAIQKPAFGLGIDYAQKFGQTSSIAASYSYKSENEVEESKLNFGAVKQSVDGGNSVGISAGLTSGTKGQNLSFKLGASLAVDEATETISKGIDRVIDFFSIKSNSLLLDSNLDKSVAKPTPFAPSSASNIFNYSLSANNQSFRPIFSENSQFVVITSAATNLISSDTNNVQDVFFINLESNTVERASVANDGTESNGKSEGFAISADGNYIVFASNASNLVADDSNNVRDIFVRDRIANTTKRVSLANDNSQANGVSDLAAISANGRYVVFSSIASNLVAGDTNEMVDVFVRDLETETTELISTAVNNSQSNNDSLSPNAAISEDGRYVVFYSYASNLVANDTNGVADIFVRDRQSGTTKRISNGINGTEADGISLSPSISADGRYVVFSSLASNLVLADNNNTGDIFVYDLTAEILERVSLTTNEIELDSNSSRPSISPDGRYVAFQSRAANLGVDNPDFYSNIYLRDRVTGETKLVSPALNSKLDGDSSNPSIAGNASIAFESGTTNLVEGDTNNASDIFVYKPVNSDPPTLVKFINIPQTPVTNPINSVEVEFSEIINLSTFDYQDITLTRDGGSNLITNAVTIEYLSGNTYRINGLGSLTQALGNYTLQVNTLGIQDQAGNQGIEPKNATFTIQSPSTPGVTITQSNGSTNVTEGGATDSYTVVLRTQPTADVTINLAIGNQIATDKTTLIFTAANWNVAQSTTVTAIDDKITEGTQTNTITHTTSSSDSNYNSLTIPTVNVGIQDNDAEVHGIIWNDINGNGVRDNSEPTLSGWKVYLDSNNNNLLDTGEVSTTSDSQGAYTFNDLRPNTYAIAQVVQDGYKQTYPVINVSTTASTEKIFTHSDILSTSSNTQNNSATHLINLDGFQADPRFANIKGQSYSTVIIDTGIDLDNPLFGADSDRNGIADKIIYKYDFADQDTDASDKNGHGSNIASIAASVASDANIIALKVFKDNGSGYFSDLEAALQWVNQNAQKYNIASVNLSLGDGQNWNTGNPRYGIGDELAAIASQNIIIAAAAGNSFYQFNSNPGLAYPAADPNTISVGAVWADNFGTNKSFSGGAIDYTTDSDRIASFSQRSADQLDVFAPGIFITGANATGGTQSMGGTSQATPFISGLAVLAQQIAQEKLNRKLTLNEFRTLLDTTSVLINDGDNENDNVKNTGKNFPRVKALALAEGILKLNSQVSTTDNSNSNTNSTSDPLYLPSGSVKLTQTVTLVSGQTATDINFGNQLLNNAPTLVNTIADQNAKQGNSFNFQIPTNTFTDIDAGDVLTYSATLENGNALPSWLTFNSTTHTFSGTPTNDNVSSLNVKAIATDKAGVSVSDIFAITVENVNDAPILSNAIVDQNAKQGTAFNFQIPTNTFTDIDAGDVLTYSATLENSNALPSWLTFNPTTRSFSGTPANDTVGNLNVKVAATDTIGAIATDTFTIKVQNVNTAPILKNQLVDQTVKVNSTFTFTLPKDTFSDPDAVNPYKNLVIFGDSLSDTGNAYKASGNTFPPSPNYQGRLSNGSIWVDYFAPDLQFTNPSIQNYAFLGANTGVSNTFGQITVPGLLTQIQQFKTVNTNSIGKDGLYVIWAGANDFLNLATDPTQAVTNAVTNISSAITTLAGLGAKEIVVGNLSDLGATPLSIANNNVANARAISIGFNAALTQALTNLEPALNVDLSLVDIFGLSTAFQTNPANYKFTNITQPLITVTTPVNPDQYAFWDDVHPTTRLHQLVTDTFENTLLNDAVIPDLIKYSATLADGSNLPDWLNFNSTTRTFSGTPNTGNVGKLDVKVIATDKAGATVNDIFTLAVNQSTTVGTPGDDKLIATPASQFDGQSNIVFTGAGKDEVDLSTVSVFPNSGNNIVDLGSGEDTIFVNKGDRAFGSDGNDTFDARDGQGNNRMSGGLGDDTFYLGSNDRALGGDGKDIFRVSLGGGNLISGGAGADQFWIVNAELPSSANTVLDFQLGTDVIGISGAVSLGITTSTLKLNQVGADTAIVFNNQTLATLTGIQASSLSLTDPKQFVFA